jgi:anti-sigma B factor antagonist
MIPPPRHITVERHGDVFCVTLRHRHLDECAVRQMGEEVIDLIVKSGCRKLVFSFGPESPNCLYSVFLVKLMMIRRRMQEHEGALKLCDVGPEVHDVFEVCQLHHFFDFAPDRASAVAAFANGGCRS